MGCSRSLIAAPSVNLLTVIMLLSVFLLPDVQSQTKCGKTASLTIEAPQKIEALEGSCLQIPCSFKEKPDKEVDNSKEIFGVWIKSDPVFDKNPNNVIFNSSKIQNIYKMTLTGDLRQKNCTTVFSDLIKPHSDKYFFRIENESFKATAFCHPVQITVSDSAWKPRIEISGDGQQQNSVTVTCSAFTPCPRSPPELTCNLQQVSHRLAENPDGTFTTEIQMTFPLSDTHDGLNISCCARYPVYDPELDASEDTSAPISPSRWVSAGSWVKLNCSIRSTTHVSNFSWSRISSEGVMTVAEGNVYRFNIAEGGAYYCEAAEDEGKQFRVSMCITIKILGIAMLCSAIIIFECWFRSRVSSKQEKDREEEDNIHRVMETQTS
ncbi:myelin-associated glycoprotein [Nothobranchius furzeri]|uniref:Myelin-associated glycoprotein-like n=1 Tax=Nothobranchius furzeri TaxID=105023 RepID=A0A9D2XBE3_NOTFU|nr:myelin-associated glycoprotein-like [Nothobranchius furzeri]